MNPGALVMSLASQGVELRLGADGRVKWRAPAGVMTDEVLAQLRQHRDAIRVWLQGRCRECLAGLYDDDSVASGSCRSCRSCDMSQPVEERQEAA